MSTIGGPRLAGLGHPGNNNLRVALDAGFHDSFAGEAASNRLYNPDANGRFTTSNGWGTYQTNQYNSNTYFDIGTIASVNTTLNQVTMSAWAWGMYSFDCLQPQTSGYGLSAYTPYFIFFIGGTSSSNSNTFEIYTYNASQNGSQGYINPATGYPAVYDGILGNGRTIGGTTGSAGSGIVSLSATGTFPEMWWGSPHKPNTALVKEVVPNGGRIKGTPCLRIHKTRYWRNLAGDGWAYGANATGITQGDTIRVSFWYRPSPGGFGGAGTLGQGASWSTHFSGGSGSSSSLTFSSTVGDWRYETYTWTASVSYGFIFYFWPYGAYQYSIDIADLMYTINDGGAVPWCNVRSTSNTGASTTGGWADLSGNQQDGDFSADMGPADLFHFQGRGAQVSGMQKGGADMHIMVNTDGSAATNATIGTASTDPMFINFDGTDDYVNCGNPGASNIGTNGTVCVWVNPSDLVNDRFIWSKNATGGSTTYVTARLASSGKVAFALYGSWGWSPTIYTVNPLVIGEWTHLAFTWYTDGLALYRDGVLQNTAVESGTWGGGGTNSLWFGSSESNQPGDWNGKMAAAQLYSKTLTAAEIKQNFNTVKDRFKANPPQLTPPTRLHMDAANPASYSGSGTTWYDIGPYGFSATATGSPPWTASPGYFEFNGSNQYMNFGAIDLLANLGSFTFGAWVWIDALSGGHHRIMSQEVNYYLGHYNAGMSTYLSGSSSGWPYNSVAMGSPPAGEWIYMVWKKSAGTVYHYIFKHTGGGNTGLTMSGPATMGDNAGNNYIGTYSGLQQVWDGKIAAIHVYNTALTDAQIGDNFLAGRERFGV